MEEQGLTSFTASGDFEPCEFLQLVRGVLSRVRDGDPTAVNWCLQSLRARFYRDALSFSLSLLCPEVASLKQTSRDVGRLLIDSFRKAEADFPSRLVQEWEPTEVSHSLNQGLYAALLEERGASELATSEPDVWLLLGRGAQDPTQLANQYARCAMASTFCSMGTVHTLVERGFRPLIIVKDDPARQGNLRFMRDRFEKDFHFLSCYVLRDGRKCYLPEPDRKGELAIRSGTLEEFVGVFDIAPSIANAASNEGHADGHLFLLAIEPRNDLQVLPISLRHVDFRQNFHLNPGIQRNLTIQMLPFSNSSEAHSQMHNAFRRDPDYRGYQLELKPAGIRDHTDRIAILRAQLQHIQTQLDFLIASAQERRQLYRFGHQHLGALASLLRSIPQQVLQSRRILYGFFGTEAALPDNLPADGFPELGYHFLYFEDGSWDIDGSNPLGHLMRSHEDIVEFWTDPWWEGTYSKDPDETCLVFVPRFEALFPIMHAWTADEMDTYLRECLDEILPRETPVPSLPMYVFDHGDGEGIRITVLDRERFVPFSKRLGWMNDQLDIIHELRALLKDPHALDRSSLAQANSIRWEKISKLFESRCEDRRRALESHSEVMMRTVQGKLLNDLRLMDATLVEYREESGRLLREASDLAQKNQALGAHIRRLTEAAARIVDAPTTADSVRQESEGRFGQVEARVLETLERSARAREKVEREVASEIEALRDLRLRLIERIRKVFRGR